MEKVPNICGFARSVGHRFGCAAVSKVPLFELGAFVRKNNNAPVLDHMFVNTFRTLIAYGLKRDQNVFSFAVMHHLNMTKGNWVLQCPKEARLPNHERGMLGRCGAPVFPSVGTTFKLPSKAREPDSCGYVPWAFRTPLPARSGYPTGASILKVGLVPHVQPTRTSQLPCKGQTANLMNR